MLSKITFHLLSNPKSLRKLKIELEEALPDDTIPDSQQVENLPYLVSGLRRWNLGIEKR